MGMYTEYYYKIKFDLNNQTKGFYKFIIDYKNMYEEATDDNYFDKLKEFQNNYSRLKGSLLDNFLKSKRWDNILNNLEYKIYNDTITINATLDSYELEPEIKNGWSIYEFREILESLPLVEGYFYSRYEEFDSYEKYVVIDGKLTYKGE